MKYCPTCETKYDEDILRFCIKDGTPLVDQKKPEFKEIPSETPEDDDPNEQTVIRRNTSAQLPSDVGSDGDTFVSSKRISDRDGDRIVVSTSHLNQPNPDPHQDQHSHHQQSSGSQGIRPVDAPRSEDRHKNKKKGGNTAMIVVASIVGTLAVLAIGFGLFWIFGGNNSPDENVNTNIDMNITEEQNTNFSANDLLENMNLDSNINMNSNMNSNMDFNINVEKVATPTPSPTKTPTPTPTETPSPDQSNTNIGPSPIPTPKPVTPKPTPTPKPTSPGNSNEQVNAGQLNGRAISLPSPSYSAAARSAKASGSVVVRVTLDQDGNVTSAAATSGHPLLAREAESAALRSRFKPITRNGEAVRASGTIAYKFVN